MATKDRENIVLAISNMLDNPDEHGIYPTSTAYTRLEHYMNQVRLEAIGYAHALCCSYLDKGEDPRIIEIPVILDRVRRDLSI